MNLEEERLANPVIGSQEVRRATKILLRYKAGKSQLEKRIISAENWWKMRHWAEMGGGGNEDKPVSAWLFNVIMGKQADAVADYPEPNILPREESDKGEAKMLSGVLPCVLDNCHFEQTYADCAWQKMKFGTGVYGIFWDPTLLGGMGDISIRRCEPLNLFWKPGIGDIEDSPHFFSVSVVENEVLESLYPQLVGKQKNSGLTVSHYVYDDRADTEDASLVVDWYYKVRRGGKTLLHYCKYVGDTVLYASENDPLRQEGFYTDGQYPFVFDVLFPVEGSPCGYGYIDLCKSPQEWIDRLNNAIVKNAVLASTPRFFIRTDGAVNESEFADWTKPFVHVNGTLGDDTLRQIQIAPLSGTYVTILNNKIEELKYTSGNQDVANGTTASGVTAASAIAALQEAAGRSSKAATKSAYRAYGKIIEKCIERIRQFYDLPRKFRIVGPMGAEEYITYCASGLQPRKQEAPFGIETGCRLPAFDVRVSAQKESPYSKVSQNELALQLYSQGFFNPQMRDQALATLEMMDFNGKDSMMQRIASAGTMAEKLALYQELAWTLAARYEPETAKRLPVSGSMPMPSGETPTLSKSESEPMAMARKESEESTSPND